MKVVIFGLSITSSWGNGHATLWRGLCSALANRRHEVHFFEHDVPYYANHRDLTELPGVTLRLYQDWPDARALAARELRDADVGIVTSYCPDALPATDAILDSSAEIKCFYDLDTPVTLSRLKAGESVEYIGPNRLSCFDLVLSYTGGRALAELKTRLGAHIVKPLYGSVDPAQHHPVPAEPRYACSLSYLGTYAEDRQQALDRLFIEPARQLPEKRFVMAGAMYPERFPWTPNIFFLRHLPPAEHAAFYSSSALTVNVTRRAMADMGYCPSGRLFEAAACGTPILSDTWEGLDDFFEPGSEILTADNLHETLQAINLPDGDLKRIGTRARQRVLDCHTSAIRAQDFERAIESVRPTPVEA